MNKKINATQLLKVKTSLRGGSAPAEARRK